MAGDELPPLVTRLTADLSDLESGLTRGKVLVDAYAKDVGAQFADGKGVGEQFGKDISDGIQDAIPPGFGKDIDDKIKEPIKKSGTESGLAFSGGFRDALDRSLGSSAVTDDALVRGIGAKGDPAGKGFSVSFGSAVRDSLTQSSVASILDPSGPVGQSIVEDGKKTGDQAGKAAGNAAGQGMSPLIKAAFAGAATAGPGLLLAGTAAAVLGAGALITKGNEDLSASYKTLGYDASAAITQATAPLVSALQASVNVLDQGIAKAEPQLRNLFSAAAPEATALATGISDLANNALPGMVTGLRALAPYSKELAADLGELGTGVSGLFSGLAGGAGGGTQGLSAIIDLTSHLLTDVGQITGALSNGLGPALHDVDVVAVPVATALTDVVKAIPPSVVEAAAVATAGLFTAFKVGAITGAVEEGTSFLGFLGAAQTAEAATAAETGVLSGAMAGLGSAMDVMLGPLGIAIVAFEAGKEAVDQFSGKNSGGGLAGIVKKQQDAATASKIHSDALTKQAQTTDSLSSALQTQVGQIGTSAEKSADATLAAVGLTDGQSNLTTSLYNSLQAYSEATTAASGYGTILKSLAGGYGDLQAAEAQVDSNLTSLVKNQKQLGDSFTVGKGAGDQNIQLMNSYKTSVLSAAQAIAQQDEQTGKSQQVTKDLTTYIDQQRDAFVAQEGKILGSTKAAGQLFDKYIDIKNIGTLTTNIDANTSQANKALEAFVSRVNSSSGTVQVYATSGNPTGGKALTYDDGGFVNAPPGSPVPATVHGQEYVLSQDMLAGRQAVDPRVLAALRGGGYGEARQAVGYAPGGGSSVTNIFVQAGTVLTSTIQFQQAVTAALAQQGLRMTNQFLSVQQVRGLK